MNVNEMFRKAICVIALLIILPTNGNVCVINASSQTMVSYNKEEGSLMGAFTKLSKLDTFEKIDPKEYEHLFPEEFGDSQGLVAPNSHLRDEILKILKEIPYTYLYSESRTQNDKISRCYIEPTNSGKCQMMYVIVGNGGNDVVVGLFSGAQIKKYEEFGDSFKQEPFEEVEEAVVKNNAECPIVVSSGVELTSMAINDRYLTIRMKIDTNGIGLSGINKEQGKTTLKGIGKYQVSQFFNLNIGVKIVCTSETGESTTLIFEHEDLAEILNDTDVSPEDVLQTYIENNKKACPLEIEEGMYMTDVSFIEDILCHVITVDEGMYSIDLLNENSQTLKQNISELISSGQEQMLVTIARWLVKVNKGFAYMYVGNESEEIATIVFTSEELEDLLSR